MSAEKHRNKSKKILIFGPLSINEILECLINW